MIEVLQPGLTTIQDLGRKGWEAFGMPRSGALDPFFARVANKLAGNQPDSPLLEFALVGPLLRSDKAYTLVLVAHSARYSLDGNKVPEFQAFPVSPGSKLSFEGMEGWFGYIAVSGGIQAEEILGSSSAYTAGGIAGRLRQGDELKTGKKNEQCFALKKESLGLRQDHVLQILEAAHTHLFSEQSKHLLSSGEFTISAQSDRMGIRLQGVALEVPEVRRSVPTLPGVVQVARSGQPIILGPEGPVTGGYPQIGILSEASWTSLAAIQPGKSIRFEWINLDAALEFRNQRNSIFSNTLAWKPLSGL